MPCCCMLFRPSRWIALGVLSGTMSMAEQDAGARDGGGKRDPRCDKKRRLSISFLSLWTYSRIQNGSVCLYTSELRWRRRRVNEKKKNWKENGWRNRWKPVRRAEGLGEKRGKIKVTPRPTWAGKLRELNPTKTASRKGALTKGRQRRKQHTN